MTVQLKWLFICMIKITQSKYVKNKWAEQTISTYISSKGREVSLFPLYCRALIVTDCVLHWCTAVLWSIYKRCGSVELLWVTHTHTHMGQMVCLTLVFPSLPLFFMRLQTSFCFKASSGPSAQGRPMKTNVFIRSWSRPPLASTSLSVAGVSQIKLLWYPSIISISPGPVPCNTRPGLNGN